MNNLEQPGLAQARAYITFDMQSFRSYNRSEPSSCPRDAWNLNQRNDASHELKALSQYFATIGAGAAVSNL